MSSISYNNFFGKTALDLEDCLSKLEEAHYNKDMNLEQYLKSLTLEEQFTFQRLADIAGKFDGLVTAMDLPG